MTAYIFHHWRNVHFPPIRDEILSFEAKNRLMALAINGVVSDVANSMVDKFCERAAEIYG